MGEVVRTWFVKFDNPSETSRWTQGDRLDRLAIAQTLVQEARAAGAPGVLLHSHDGVELWRWEHGQSVDDDLEAVEKFLVRPGQACEHVDQDPGWLVPVVGSNKADFISGADLLIPRTEQMHPVWRCFHCGAFSGRLHP